MQEILNGKNIFLSNSQTIHKDLENAFTCVTFSSGSAIDSLIEGVPVIATDKRSFAYEISENNINNLFEMKTNDRVPLLSALANIHWSLSEIQNGEAANFFLNLIETK